MDNDTITKLISVREAMEMMGVKRTTFYNEVNKGNIVLKRLSERKSLVPLESVKQWIEGLPTKSEVEGK